MLISLVKQVNIEKHNAEVYRMQPIGSIGILDLDTSTTKVVRPWYDTHLCCLVREISQLLCSGSFISPEYFEESLIFILLLHSN